MAHPTINFFKALLPFFVKAGQRIADNEERIRRKRGRFAKYIPYYHGHPNILCGAFEFTESIKYGTQIAYLR
jgi:hypothetical protein